MTQHFEFLGLNDKTQLVSRPAGNPGANGWFL